MARTKSKITKKAYEEAIEKSNGTRINLAARLNITAGAVTQYLEKNPDLAELLDKKRLDNIERAETEIYEQLDFHDGENPAADARVRQTAANIILKGIGKDRGWVDKQQVEHSGEVDTKIEVIIPKEVKELIDGE